MHEHECQICEQSYKCNLPGCAPEDDHECDYCYADGERDLSASIEDYRNWVN